MCNNWPIIAALWLLAAIAPALAMTIDTPLPDPAQEARARALFYDIRCVVCQSETIAESPADVAADMRRVIRRRIAAGDSDQAIKDYLVSHYGNFILMTPPLEQATWLLWFGPLVFLGLAGLLAAWYFRQNAKSGKA